MKYNGQYIWPPRPSTAIKPFGTTYNRFKTIPNIIAQLKMNGQRNEIKVMPVGDSWDLSLWNRHHSRHLNYSPPAWLRDELLEILKPQVGKSYVWDSELLDTKHRSVKNSIYIYDLLVYEDEYLVGTSYGKRYDMMTDHFHAAEAPRSDYAITLSSNVWMAFNLKPDEWDEYWKLSDKYWDYNTKTGLVEGFVFKNLNGRLLPGFQEDNNGDWLFRCRKQTKMARF